MRIQRPKYSNAIAAAMACAIGSQASAATRCVATADELKAALLATQSSSGSDEIRIRTGLYAAPEGGWKVDIQLRGITIAGGYLDVACQSQSLDGALTVLDGRHAVRPLTIDTSFQAGQNNGRIVVSGLTIQNGLGGGVGGLKVSDSGPIYNGRILVERNVFRDNESTDYQEGNSAGGLLAATDGVNDGGVDLIVRDNLFVSNRARTAAAAMLFSNDKIAITNNTISDNQSVDASLPLRVTVGLFTFSGAILSNNILWNNHIDVAAANYDIDADMGFASLRLVSLLNDDMQAVHGTPIAEQGTVVLDPPFVDVAAGNFRPTATSSLNDGGVDDPLGGLGSTDLDGMPRLWGAHVGLGAYEVGDTPDLVFENGFD